MLYVPRAHAQRGEVIGFVVVVVVVVVSKKNLQIQILGKFASANCGYGVGNRKKAGVQVSRLSKRDHESYKSCFCWSRLLVTPTAIICMCIRPARAHARLLLHASTIFCTLAHSGYRSIFTGSMNDGNC